MDPLTGGTSQGVRNTIPELARHNFSNEVLCLDGPSASYLGKDDFSIHALGPGRGPWCYSSNLLPWLSQNLQRFDAVIIHGLWLYTSYATTKAFKQHLSSGKSNHPNIIRLFVMPHGMLDPYFQKAAGRRLKALRNWLYWKAIESKVIETCDKVLFTTQTELLLARQTFTPYKPKSEKNIGFGIQNPPVFDHNNEHSLSRLFPQIADKRYLLFISRIHPKKGIDLLVEAYIDILHSAASKNIPALDELPLLVVAGPGADSPFGQALVRKVEDSEIASSKIFFIGMVTGPAKWQVFYGCEAFVLNSHQENFGIAVAEALACNKPVLISDQVNIWREIDAAEAGFVAPDTKEGTKEVLLKWLALNAEQKQQISARAKHCFNSHFTIQSAVGNLVKAIS